MAKTIRRLTHQQVGSASLEPGLYGDGGNLYLRVKPDGNRSWVFIYRHSGKQRELGLGKAGKGKGAVTLKTARDQAKKGRALLDQQPPVDPRTVWRARPAQSAPTFTEAAADYIAQHTPKWKHPKHVQQWRYTIAVCCKPLHDLPVDQIGVEDVRSILRPLWLRAPETASRVRGRIETVIDHAMPPDVVQTNPARWLAKKFRDPKGAGKIDRKTGERVERGNFAALAYKDAPAFAGRLREESGVPERALEFLLLVAARTSEVIGAKWSEIDLGTRLWTVPPERLKTGKRTRAPHKVPLSDRALELLEEMAAIRMSDFVFPGRIDGQPLHSQALRMVAQRLDPAITVHGLRSTFRDFAGDCTNFPREIAEAALGHIVGGVEGAYRRGSGVERRRELMAAWGSYLAGTSEDAGNVILIARDIGGRRDG